MTELSGKSLRLQTCFTGGTPLQLVGLKKGVSPFHPSPYAVQWFVGLSLWSPPSPSPPSSHLCLPLVTTIRYKKFLSMSYRNPTLISPVHPGLMHTVNLSVQVLRRVLYPLFWYHARYTAGTIVTKRHSQDDCFGPIQESEGSQQDTKAERYRHRKHGSALTGHDGASDKSRLLSKEWRK